MWTRLQSLVDPRRCRLAAITLGVAILGAAAESLAQNECLVSVRGPGGDLADKATLCGEAQNRACVFPLQLCLNQPEAGCTPGPMRKKVKVKGPCGRVGKLRVRPDGSNPVCGTSAGVKVKTKKKGKREGRCFIVVSVRTKERPLRYDVDLLRFVCKPNPGDCPAVTSTTIPRPVITGPCITPCPCCVLPATDLQRCVTP